MGTFSGPKGGTSSIEKRQRSIKMKGTSIVELTVELQMELQKVRMLCKKRCCKRFFFALIGKDIQNDFKKMYKILEFFGLSFFRCLFREKGILYLEGTIQVP